MVQKGNYLPLTFGFGLEHIADGVLRKVTTYLSQNPDRMLNTVLEHYRKGNYLPLT